MRTFVKSTNFHFRCRKFHHHTSKSTRTTAVPKTVPFRYSLVLTPEIKALIARKNTLRRNAQRTKNSGDKRNYETLNSIVKDACQELQNKNFGQKLSTN
jgi:hypothetical protein